MRTHSASDLVMAEAPAQTPPPRSFSATSLSEADAKTIQELTTYLADNSYDYNSHAQLINLLHRGFQAHTDTPLNESGQPSNPADYPWLTELRMARGAMDSRYAVGEDIWRDWINDESALAHSSEERSAVMELCMRAVQEEPASVVLWSLYGEWVWSTYAVANGYMEGDEDTWSEEDKLICKEVFSRKMVLSVWSQAVEATKWRMDESQVVWNRYAELVMQDLPEQPTSQTIEEVQLLYMNRLQIPHAHWEGTSQSFWPFISKHKADSWEETMSATNEIAAAAKDEHNKREMHELELTKAFRSNDSAALYNAFSAYLHWESKFKKKRGPFDHELRCALYERALLRFPTLVEWWLDYVDYLTTLDTASTGILPLLERATRHCPWSGELWARRLLRVELDTQMYDEVEGVKHKATNSGLLPTGGMEEILLVYSTWCSYLRRRAFTSLATDDDVDMAEMAIAECLNDVENDGKKAYGDDFKGDPLWRIEKIFIKFLTQARRMQEARGQWARLVPLQGHSYDFWAQYYEWEIFVWGAERTVFNLRVEGPGTQPRLASEVLREAMKQKNLDWPEKIHQLYAHHFQTHESPEEIQKAQVALRRSQKALKARRDREAEAAAAEAQAAAPTAQPLSEESVFTAKRKRDDEPDTNGDSAKRNKTEDIAPDDVRTEPSASASAQIKRDRENNSITVLRLPTDITEKRLRQFFGDCGTIFSVNIAQDDQTASATATIEFEAPEDVVTARTRDGKTLDGAEIQVKSGTQSTLYVTNYPASFAENEVRDLFSSYGTIVSIRFPSLKFNQRRRFCYVQFSTSQEAQAATQLHDKAIDGSSRLVVLISDPDAKKHRQGAISEGREIHIGNIEHAATEDDLREFFAEAGTIETVRMLHAANGKFTGTAFIIFSKSDEAQAALNFNNRPLQSRILRVSLATDKSSRDAANKKHGTTKVFEAAKTASPAPEGAADASSPPAEGESNDTAKTKRERTVALLNLPDTVNDVRVHDFFAAFGPIRKLTVRRDKGGALVEFVNVADAGKVSMNVDASSLGPECKVGEVATLLAGGKKNAGATEKKNGLGMRPASVSRPGQNGGRGGRRGGLGFKRGGAGVEGKEQEGEKGKSNSDFREMFLAGKKEE
ncbi:hypothetical protein BDZ85DRAFT_196080 [Elsinoe ampelina]|uniref:U4/U6 snRNA-associated-splicing factor PRP24 n=1 Tax=Elsinoe ampelina TaxID=302913 RepID=A0A6A6GEF9_9PEZI|nr:hypothetical protein BDZ85DRAFT_196080 [Elsinoe ampelina]